SRAGRRRCRSGSRRGDAVDRSRGLLADIAVGEIVPYRLRIALGRGPVAPAAGTDQAEPLARRRLAVGELRRQLDLGVAAVEEHGAWRSLAAAEEAGRRVERAVALDRVAGRLEELEFADRPE